MTFLKWASARHLSVSHRFDSLLLSFVVFIELLSSEQLMSENGAFVLRRESLFSEWGFRIVWWFGVLAIRDLCFVAYVHVAVTSEAEGFLNVSPSTNSIST